jgi:hypothetical protein
MTRKSKGVCCALFALALCSSVAMSAFAQTPSPPPIKMGLWQSNVTTTMGGFQIPPDVAEKMRAMGRPVPGGPQTTAVQSCMTADEWGKTWEKMNSNGDQKCTSTNRTLEEHKLSFDESCVSPRGGTFTGHFEMQFDDDEHSHGSLHMKGEQGPSGQPITIDMTMNSHFVAADCGEVKPGEAKVLKTE